jgi:N-methylhydantoinase B
VTVEGAKRYGVVLHQDLTVDQRATEELRRKLTGDRREIKLFNTGGTVEELKARCKAETYLDPPETPRFQKWMKKAAAPR